MGAVVSSRVYEADDRRRLLLITCAKGAIERQQARASLRATEERQAFEDAAYVLAALRKAAEFNLERGLKRGRSDVVLRVRTLVFD